MPKGSVCWLSASEQISLKSGHSSGLLKCEKKLLGRQSTHYGVRQNLLPIRSLPLGSLLWAFDSFSCKMRIKNTTLQGCCEMGWNNMWTCPRAWHKYRCQGPAGLSWSARGFGFHPLVPLLALPSRTWVCNSKTTLLCWDFPGISPPAWRETGLASWTSFTWIFKIAVDKFIHQFLCIVWSEERVKEPKWDHFMTILRKYVKIIKWKSPTFPTCRQAGA